MIRPIASISEHALPNEIIDSSGTALNDGEVKTFSNRDLKKINRYEKKDKTNVYFGEGLRSVLSNTILNGLSKIEYIYTSSNPNVDAFRHNPDAKNVICLGSLSNCAIMKNGKMVAILFRKVISQDIINCLKEFPYTIDYQTRTEAGSYWPPSDSSFLESFKNLANVDLKDCDAGTYIFPNANAAVGVKKIIKKHLVFIKTDSRSKAFQSFRVYYPDSAWSSKDAHVSKDQNDVLHAIKNIGRHSGSFVKDGVTVFFRNEQHETIVAECTGKVKVNLCTKSVPSESFGSKECHGKGLPSHMRGLTSPCTPYVFPKAIENIRGVVNCIFSMVYQNASLGSSLNEMLRTHVDHSAKLAPWTGPNGYFSTVNVNFSSFNLPTTNFHTDKNIGDNCITALLATGTGYKGGETVFPELLHNNKVLGIDLREGDVLFFKSKELLHGNLPVYQDFGLDSEKESQYHLLRNKENRRSYVLYNNNNLLGCKHVIK